MVVRLSAALCSVALLLAGCLAVQAGVPVSQVRIVARFPHDPNAFTQGLAFAEGELYEGTGGYGRSSLRRVDLASGRVLERVALPRQFFGEGITAWRDELIQLTWRAGIGLRYRRASLTETGRFSVAGEGWGLTDDGRHWIMSDGSAELRFLEPADGKEVRRLPVSDDGKPVRRLNELEFVRGEVWANIWYQDRLARIDPATGRVLGYVDLSDLWPRDRARERAQVLNGIAFEPETGRLFVTGKRWPWLYRIAIPALGID
ncbi:glutamine cyclotransferase [Halochromatium glycolicum]|uniref:Glutamine cyclotransferase n=1 Tax=Halochromatium glycolicum TaxID=85075 RepID=A0AAJ0U0D4_9GAMM|nr:glutamine cyclotransferase [Halochromatium glycolicum]